MVATAYAYRPVDASVRLQRIRRLAWLLDAQFVVPGTAFRFGVNSLLGLAPAFGDIVLGLLSLYIINEARMMGVPAALLLRMLVNVAVEVGGGSVPLLGDLFDMAFKANLRNVAIIEEWAARGRV